MVIVWCSGGHPDFIKRVIKRVNVERGNVGSNQRSDEQRSLKRLRTDTRNFIKRVTACPDLIWHLRPSAFRVRAVHLQRTRPRKR
jgi:hypothetical protein